MAKDKLTLEFVPDEEINEDEKRTLRDNAGKLFDMKKKKAPWKQLIKLESFAYKLPIIGKKLMEKRIKQGFIICEVIMPNQNSTFFMIDTRYNAFTKEVENEKEKIFYLGKIKKKPQKYIRIVERMPVVTFDWDSGHPVPIDKNAEIDIDFDFYNDIVMRARMVGASSRLTEWLEQQGKLIKFAVATSGISLAFQILKYMEII